MALLLLLVRVGQLREIYLSYLEDLNLIRILWALAGFALISAAFYEAHYWLSTMRINVIYSNLAFPNSGTRIRALQRAAAFSWSLFPWAGLAAGLFLADGYLVDTRVNLEAAQPTAAPIGTGDIAALNTLPESRAWTIACVVVLAAVLGKLFDASRQAASYRASWSA